MRIIRGADNTPTACHGNIYLALGNFDGVHTGHQSVIKEAVRMAGDSGGVSAVLILDPHPANFFNPRGGVRLISDPDMKKELLAGLGLDYMIIEPFDLSLAGLSPEEFIMYYLKEKIKVKGVICGFDYSFGKNAGGDPFCLEEWSRRLSFELRVCPPVKINGKTVSSSNIRRLLAAGQIERASYLLNYHFYRTGIVIKGDGRGKTLGYPTANLLTNPQLILPEEGVYYTVTNLNGQMFLSATNIGSCPTFREGRISVETHILDFFDDLYGQDLTVYFIKKIRDEIAFADVEALTGQMEADIKQIRTGYDPGHFMQTGFFNSSITCCLP